MLQKAVRYDVCATVKLSVHVSDEGDLSLMGKEIKEGFSEDAES